MEEQNLQRTRLEKSAKDMIAVKVLMKYIKIIIMYLVLLFIELHIDKCTKILNKPVSTIPKVEMPGSRATIST